MKNHLICLQGQSFLLGGERGATINFLKYKRQMVRFQGIWKWRYGGLVEIIGWNIFTLKGGGVL